MNIFKKLFTQSEAEQSPSVEITNSEAEKLRRISSLTGDEEKAFEWFKQGYSARWTAETMLLDRRTAKKLFASVFSKLGVLDETEVCKYYRTTPLRPDDIPPEDDVL